MSSPASAAATSAFGFVFAWADRTPALRSRYPSALKCSRPARSPQGCSGASIHEMGFSLMSMPFDATLKDLARDSPADHLMAFDRPPAGTVTLLNVDLSTVTTAADLA